MQNATMGNIRMSTRDQTRSVKKSASGASMRMTSRSTPKAGVLKRVAIITSPAPITRAKSIIRSLMKGRVWLIPQAALMPFLMAPNAAEAAVNSPSTLASPVNALALTTSSTVPLMNSLETGSASASRTASSSRSASGPRTKPSTEIMARKSGKSEKSM